MVIYLIYKGNFPSLAHAGYKDKALAEAEAKRINDLIIASNLRIDANPATGRGSAFLNMKREPEFNVREINV